MISLFVLYMISYVWFRRLSVFWWSSNPTFHRNLVSPLNYLSQLPMIKCTLSYCFVMGAFRTGKLYLRLELAFTFDLKPPWGFTWRSLCWSPMSSQYLYPKSGPWSFPFGYDFWIHTHTHTHTHRIWHRSIDYNRKWFFVLSWFSFLL